MRHLIIKLFILLYGVNILVAQSALHQSLLAHYPLDSTAVNASQNQLPHTDLVLDKTTFSYGWLGSNDPFGALNFYGDSHARLKTALPTKEVTLSFWFNTDNAKGGTLAGWDEYGYGVRLMRGGRIYCYLHVAENTFYDFVFDQENLADGTWHQIALSYDQSTFKVFVDGKEVHKNEEYGNNKPIYYNGGSINFGALPNDDLPNHYIGKIDEILLYNRALDPQEIELLSMGAQPNWDNAPDKGLIIDLPFQNDDLNHSSNHTDAISIDDGGGSFAASCKNGDPNDKTKFFNGKSDQLAINQVIQMPQLSLSLFFNSNSAKESFIAGWEKGGYQVILNPKGEVGKIKVSLTSSEGKEYQFISSKNVNDGQCHHLVFTFDGLYFKVFLDGQLEVEDNQFGEKCSVFYASDRLLIGRAGNLDSLEGFQGKIDDLKLFNRAVTQKEVNQLYQKTTTKKASLPVDVQLFRLGGSKRNKLLPKAHLFLIRNMTNDNQRVTITNHDETEEFAKIKLEPGEIRPVKYTGIQPPVNYKVEVK